MTIQNSPEALITMQISIILRRVAAENKGLHSAKHPWMPWLAIKDVGGNHVRVMNKSIIEKVYKVLLIASLFAV